MEKKKNFKILIILVLIILLAVIVYFYFNEGNSNSENTAKSTTESTSEVNTEVKTISNTIITSGQISTGLDEKLELHATYYFEEIYYDENDYVEEGANILKYTNGTYLTAPYNLVIASLSIPDKGSKCANSHYIEVYSSDTLSMKMNISEDELSKLSVGLEVTITPSVYSDKTYTGYITKISNSGTYSSKGTTYAATVNFENDGNLKIGMSASANIILEKAENAIVVPNEAIQTSNSAKYVVVVNEDGTTQYTTVETGISNEAYTEIKSGLKDGQTIQITTSISAKTTYSSAQSGKTNYLKNQ